MRRGSRRCRDLSRWARSSKRWGGVDADDSATIDRNFIFAAANYGDWFVATHLRLKDHPNWRVHTVACGHNIMLNRPEELISLLTMAALQGGHILLRGAPHRPVGRPPAEHG